MRYVSEWRPWDKATDQPSKSSDFGERGRILVPFEIGTLSVSHWSTSEKSKIWWRGRNHVPLGTETLRLATDQPRKSPNSGEGGPKSSAAWKRDPETNHWWTKSNFRFWWESPTHFRFWWERSTHRGTHWSKKENSKFREGGRNQVPFRTETMKLLSNKVGFQILVREADT
jgi:hypothetical protein